MGSLAALCSVLLLAAASNAEELQCIEANCTEPMPFFSLRFGPLFPFLGPVDIDSNSDSKSDSSSEPDGDVEVFDQVIDPLKPINSSDDQFSPGGFSITVMRVFSIPRNDVANDQSEPQEDLKSPIFPFPFGRENLDNLGVLDLSGRNTTGAEVFANLRIHQLMSGPVTTLILSNSLIQDLSWETLQPVGENLLELQASNSSLPLSILTRFSNLRTLNLSHNGLTTFEWLPQLRDSLEVLDLSHNLLQELRPELSVLTNLKELYLSHNRISSVQEFPISMLPNLEVLSLSMNSLENAVLTSLNNLQQVDLDWNYLSWFGYNVQLPVHRMTVRLASNPWRCDCGILEATDNYDVVDIDQLKCANRGSYPLCDDCVRHFLPIKDGRLVSNLTKESIEHLGCTGLTDQFYLMRTALKKMRDNEPVKLVQLGLLVLTFSVLLVAGIMMIRQSFSKKKFNRQSWLKIQHIPYLKIDKLSKPQEVPYIKIDSPQVKV